MFMEDHEAVVYFLCEWIMLPIQVPISMMFIGTFWWAYVLAFFWGITVAAWNMIEEK